MFHFSDEVEVDEAKSCGFIGFLRNTGPVQNKVLRWLIVTRCDKMWQDVTRCDKMWQDVTRCDKMWQVQGAAANSCKMSIDPLVFYSMIEFQGNPLAIVFFFAFWVFPSENKQVPLPLAFGLGSLGETLETLETLVAIWAFAWVRTSLRRCFGAATLPRFVSGHLGWSFTVIHNTFWYFLDVWTSFEPRKESVAKAVQQPNLGLQHP